MTDSFQEVLMFQWRVVVFMWITGDVLIAYGRSTGTGYGKEFVYLGEAMNSPGKTYMMGLVFLAILIGLYLTGAWVYRKFTKQTYKHSKNELYE
jgi:hypothetical protein